MSDTQAPPLSTYQPQIDFTRSYNSWLTYSLSGVPCPGTIVRGGIKGFERKTGYDIKTGKGTKGATLTLKDQPPCKGSITSQLLTAQDVLDWDSFVSAVLNIDAKAQQADGLSIFHPSFTSIQLSAVVVEEFSPIQYDKGKGTVTVKFIEWSPPPNVSVVSTVASTAADQDSAETAPPVDPRIAARQAQIAALTSGAAAADRLGPAAGQ